MIPLGKKEKVDDSLGLSAWGPAHTATGLAAFGTECRPSYSWAERNGLTSVLAGGTRGAGAEPPFPVRVDGSDAMLKLPGLGLDCALFLLCSVPSSFLQNVGGVPEQHMPGKRRDVEMDCAKARSPTAGSWPCVSPLCLSISSCQSWHKELGDLTARAGCFENHWFSTLLPNKQLIQNS